jgi:uncharacterized protein (TIGR04562 family)
LGSFKLLCDERGSVFRIPPWWETPHPWGVSLILSLASLRFLLFFRFCFFTGGEGGIRTPGSREGTTVFKTAAFNHSATSPFKHFRFVGMKGPLCYLVRVIQATENFSFPWEILKVVVDGVSILDVPRLELKSMEEATNFMQAYGFDPANADDMEVVWAAFDDAVIFIEKSLADPRTPRVPDHLRNRKAVNDVRRLLLLASSSLDAPNKSDQMWACAILRLMHVLIHLAHDPRLKFFDQVQNQVLGRLDNYLYVDDIDGATYLGNKSEGSGIKLLFFKKKDRKDREREIIKLLHKADSLVEEIYDRIGFRLVTETKFDAIRAVRLMLEKNIISLPNVRPSRSRNRLVDMERLKLEIQRMLAQLEKTPHPSAAEFEKMGRRLERRIGFRRMGRSLINPHSSEYYRAIQFTCRELVKVHNPTYQLYAELKTQLENIHGGNQILADVFRKPMKPHDYVFFPYEIQIMDVKAYADSIFGKSNHEEYRKKQLETARERVFGPRKNHD